MALTRSRPFAERRFRKWRGHQAVGFFDFFSVGRDQEPAAGIYGLRFVSRTIWSLALTVASLGIINTLVMAISSGAARSAS